MQNPFCKYRDLIGKPNTGLRNKYRIYDIAVIDTVVTIIAAFLISYYSKYSIWIVLVIVFVSGIFFHKLFCVRTGLDKKLFPKNTVQFEN